MDQLIDNLANFFIQHSFAKGVVLYVLWSLGGLSVLSLISGCLFMAFGRQNSFHYRENSLVAKLWKAGWVLQIIGIGDLSYRLVANKTHMSEAEIVLNCTPWMLLLLAQSYGSKYHKGVRATQRKVKKKSIPDS